MFSFWETDVFLAPYDYVVLGGGLVGLNAALSLREAEPGARVAIVERGFLPTGASTKNAGFACFGSLSELIADVANQGDYEAVLALAERRYRGLLRLRARVGDAQMEFQGLGNYEAFGQEDEALYQTCLSQLAQYNQAFADLLGIEEVFQPADEQLQTFGLRGMQHLILNRAEGQIHTGKMMASLLQQAHQAGVQFFNGLSISHWEEEEQGVRLYSKGQVVLYARQLIVATNGFAAQLLPELDLWPARNQVICTEPIPDLVLKGCFHYHEGYVYFRNIGERILLGGGRHLDPLGEQTADLGLTEPIQTFLETFLLEHLAPQAKIAQRWAGILGLGPTKSPIVQRHSPHVVIAVRMGGMGVAIGSLVGEQAAQLALQTL
jgi:glycine/D-amino acid oxidase-like deaminating enzyme